MILTSFVKCFENIVKRKCIHNWCCCNSRNAQQLFQNEKYNQSPVIITSDHIHSKHSTLLSFPLSPPTCKYFFFSIRTSNFGNEVFTLNSISNRSIFYICFRSEYELTFTLGNSILLGIAKQWLTLNILSSLSWKLKKKKKSST